MERNTSLKKWSEQAEGYHTVAWDRLPELELYMDQVTSYLNRQLAALRASEEDDTILTNSMVNNYVKDGLIKRPVQKKYQREQLCGLLMICAMKSVLAIPDISKLLSSLETNRTIQDFYEKFAAMQSETLHDVAARVKECCDDSADAKTIQDLALTLTLEADARVIAAQKLIESLNDPAEVKEAKKENKK